jgi:DNA-binding Xre family transcriptional regulator
MQVRDNVAKNIKKAAKRGGIGINALADKAGVSRSQLYDVLGAKKSSTIDWLEKVGGVLDVSVSDLMRKPRSN